MHQTAVLYLRISEDRSGNMTAVARQRSECQELARRLGLEISREFVDNDISATSGARRPAFDEMLGSRPAAIIAWHQDRLLRLTKDLERVIDLDVPIYTVTAGTMDLSTPAGRAVARTVAAWSTYEGEHRRERQRAKNRQSVEAGIPLTGIRPFGFELNRIDLRPTESIIVKEIYARLLRGDSLYSVCRWLNASGVSTSRGKQWNHTTLRQLVLRPRNAGILTNGGIEIENSRIMPLVSRQEWEAVKSILENPHRDTSPGRKASVHFMSGLATCGVCGRPMRSAQVRERNGSKVAIYRCGGAGTTSTGDGRRHPSIRKHELERLVLVDLHSALIARAGDGPTDAAGAVPSELVLEKAELVARKRRVMDLYEMNGADLSHARRRLTEIDAAITEVQSRLDSAAVMTASQSLMANLRASADWLTGSQPRTSLEIFEHAATASEDFHARWAQLPIEDQRALVKAHLLVVVHPVAAKRVIFRPHPDGKPGHVEMVHRTGADGVRLPRRVEISVKT